MKIVQLDIQGFRSLKNVSWRPGDLNRRGYIPRSLLRIGLRSQPQTVKVGEATPRGDTPTAKLRRA